MCLMQHPALSRALSPSRATQYPTNKQQVARHALAPPQMPPQSDPGEVVLGCVRAAHLVTAIIRCIDVPPLRQGRWRRQANSVLVPAVAVRESCRIMSSSETSIARQARQLGCARDCETEWEHFRVPSCPLCLEYPAGDSDTAGPAS